MAERHRGRTGRDQAGFAMASILITIFVLAVLSALVLYLSGKEIALATVRRTGAQSLYIAEGGAASARAALMVLMNADPIGQASLDPSLNAGMIQGWYNAGAAPGQNSFAIFDYIVLDGQRYTIGGTPAMSSVTFEVNWGLAAPHRKLQVTGGPPPGNALGGGTYSATVVISQRAVAHSSCVLVPCYIHRLGPDDYEFFYTYAVTTDGQVPPRARRRVTLTRDFSIRTRRSSFAEFVLFRDVTTTPSGAQVWFIDRDYLDGPVHTNSEWRFVRFPRFTDRLTSAGTYASFFNRGSPVRIQANENVVGGVRRDAPVLPDATPLNLADDVDNPPANFTRGAPTVPMPTNSYSQKGVSIGRDPFDTGPVSNLQIRQAVPELTDNGNPVPTGIYVPVTDANGNGVSNALEPLAGGIYVQGDLTSLTLSVGGASNNLAVYTFVQGAQTVTVTVDRVAQTTTVANSAWPVPQTRIFTGVPKGWQGPGNANAGIIFVEGGILSLRGTLEEQEQTTIAASGRIDITNNLLYEDPPDTSDPNDDPTNLLGVYSSGNHIRLGAGAPNDLTIHAVLMAGNRSDGFNSSVNAENYDTRPIGTFHLTGGIIEEYSGPIGTMDASGNQLSGYARDFHYDRRMSRGFAPPYFPTTTRFEVVGGSEPLAGVRPVWREAAP